VHLGTMGVYGYGTAGVRVPEGYLPVVVQTDNGPQEIEILYPADPGSIYHMTKTQDALFFHYYNKNYGIRITDLHQGIVWGTQTKETRLAPELVNRFDYCGDYGTVLNRFLVEAAIGYPLTVHGIRRADAGLYQHTGYGPLHRIGHQPSGRQPPAGQYLQSDDRDTPRDRSRKTNL
jgi:UDP-sulfoquinovose synthase